MQYQIGQFAYRMTGNTENTIVGGFVGGGSCGNLTIIKHEGTGYNHFRSERPSPKSHGKGVPKHAAHEGSVSPQHLLHGRHHFSESVGACM